MPDVTGRRDVTVGVASRQTIHTGAQCRFWKAHRWGTKDTSHSEHDERIRFSPKSSEYCPSATVIQRSKHCTCQTPVLGKKQVRIVGHELLPIRDGQALDQARRPSTTSSIGLSSAVRCTCARTGTDARRWYNEFTAVRRGPGAEIGSESRLREAWWAAPSAS